MKSFIVVALLVAAAAALPTPDDRTAEVVKIYFDNIGVDGFKAEHETSNGIKAQSEGQLVNAGQENEALVVRGQYSFVADDGQVYTVTYVADENGFHPSGAHLPVGPQ